MTERGACCPDVLLHRRIWNTEVQEMENSWKFFENRDCRYFPCHSGLTDFNCLFCYCPLYLADPCPGTPKTLKRKDGSVVRDCTYCVWPHRPENYGAVVKALAEANRSRSGKKSCREEENSTKSGKKVIFLDIDGTLTTFGGQLPSSAAKALKKAKENGHELVLCTGRTRTQIYPMLRDSGLFSGMVCGAGADVERNGRVLEEHFIDQEHLAHLVDFLASVHARYYLQCRSGLYGTSEIIHCERQMFGGDPGTTAEREKLFGKITEDNEPWKRQDVNKLAYYEADAGIDEIRKAAGDYFYVMESSFRISDRSDGEITIRGIDKAYGMQLYLKDAGVSKEDAIAFGDGPNDFEMMDFAGCGVAMGNGSDELKERADLVTDPIDEDGLANAFQKLGLI